MSVVGLEPTTIKMKVIKFFTNFVCKLTKHAAFKKLHFLKCSNNIANYDDLFKKLL